jgi:hypothetical protein
MRPTVRVAFGLALAAALATFARAQSAPPPATSESGETVVIPGVDHKFSTQRLLGSDPGLVPYPARPLPYPPGDVAPSGQAAAAPAVDAAPRAVGEAPAVAPTRRVTRQVTSRVSRPVTRQITQVTRTRPAPARVARVTPERPRTVNPAGAPYEDQRAEALAYASTGTDQSTRRPYIWDGVALVVGARLPASIRLAPVPPAVTAAFPDVASYAYAYVDDRTYLVDPATSLIKAELTR